MVKVGLGGGDEPVTEMWLGLSLRERPAPPSSAPAVAPTSLAGSGREAVESPSLEIFKTRLDKVLCSQL